MRCMHKKDTGVEMHSGGTGGGGLVATYFFRSLALPRCTKGGLTLA